MRWIKLLWESWITWQYTLYTYIGNRVLISLICGKKYNIAASRKEWSTLTVCIENNNWSLTGLTTSVKERCLTVSSLENAGVPLRIANTKDISNHLREAFVAIHQFRKAIFKSIKLIILIKEGLFVSGFSSRFFQKWKYLQKHPIDKTVRKLKNLCLYQMLMCSWFPASFCRLAPTLAASCRLLTSIRIPTQTSF